MPQLRAVLFDIDDTLFSTSQFAEKARRNAVARMVRLGLRMDVEEAYRELQEVIAEFSSNYPRHFDKLLRRIPASCSAGINPALLIAAGVIGYHETKADLRPFDDVPPALAALARTPLVLGVVSAGLEIKQAEKLIRLGVHDQLDPTAIFISDQLGVSKPNVKLYQLACTSLGLPPSTVMYVGDNPLLDVDPCNQIGMITVRSRRASRHAELDGRTRPDHEIRSFHELLGILRRDYGIEVPEVAAGPTTEPPKLSSPPGSAEEAR